MSSRQPNVVNPEMTDTAEPSLILFSGLAADESIFLRQKSEFPSLIVPDWITPLRNESLSEYCERFAQTLRPTGRCIIGGASFGGIVAMEIARYLDPLCVVLIGSVKGPAQLPSRVRVFRPMRGIVSLIPIRALQWMCGAVEVASRWMPNVASIVRQFRKADPVLVRWSVRQVLSWQLAPEVECPVYHIHGDRDFVLPVSRTNPDTIVRSGHVLTMTHPVEVNAFLRECLNRFRPDSPLPGPECD